MTMFKYSLIIFSIISLGDSLLYRKYNLLTTIREEDTKYNILANTNYRRDFNIGIKDNNLLISSPIFHTKKYYLDKNIDKKQISYKYLNRYLIVDIPKVINPDTEILNMTVSPNYTKNDNLEYISDGIIVEDIPSREIFVKNEHAVDGYYDTRGIYRYY